MARRTLATLEAQVEALRNELNTVRMLLDQERTEHAITKDMLMRECAATTQLQTQMLNVTEVASAVNRAQKPARPVYEMPQWQIDRRAAMEAAKAAALRDGKSVRVS